MLSQCYKHYTERESRINGPRDHMEQQVSHPGLATVVQPVTLCDGDKEQEFYLRKIRGKANTPPPFHPSSCNKGAHSSLIIKYNYYTNRDPRK